MDAFGSYYSAYTGQYSLYFIGVGAFYKSDILVKDNIYIKLRITKK
jgi:hypothetical protein